MMRSILRLLSAISIGLLLGFVAIMVALNTSLLTPSLEFLMSQFVVPNTKIEYARFESPNHLHLEEVSLNGMSPIQSIDTWFTLNSSSNFFSRFTHPEFDAVLISGFSFDLEQDIPLPLEKWNVHQLSIKDANISEERWHAEDVNIQWINPSWHENSAMPLGIFQAHIPQLAWQDETITDLLVDGDYQVNASQLDGISFKWKDTQFQAQATQNSESHQWVIDNLTIENLFIKEKDFSTEIKNQLGEAIKHIERVERLDLLRGQIEWQGTRLNNLELSATNLDISHSLLWEQNNAQISLKAEGIEDQDLLWIEPNIKLALNHDSVDIQDLNIGISSGDIYLSGFFEPTRALIRDASVIGIQHVIEQTLPQYPHLVSYIQNLQQLTVDKLSIHNSQIIQLLEQPYWQLSGVNVELSDSILVKEHAWSLWNGQFYASVNNLSYDKTVATQAIIEMQSDGQRLDMTRFFMPFNVGYVAAKANWNFGETGKPWRIDIETDSFPLTLLKQWQVPLNSKGLLDLQLTANGLSGDSAILRHTFSGSADATIRQGSMVLPLEKESVEQSFAIDKLHINAKNGQLKARKSIVKGPNFSGILDGGLDLTNDNPQSFFALTFDHNGHSKTIDILRPSISE